MSPRFLKLSSLCALLLLVGFGCSSSTGPNGPPPDHLTQGGDTAQDSTYLTADFEAESGSAPSPSDDPKVEGPWTGRFMEALSDDGLNWTKTGKVIGDQLNVPDLVYGPDGFLFLYFSGYTLGDRQNKTAVGISPDDGQTWNFKYLEFDGFTRDPADATVQYRDGEFWMYATYTDQEADRVRATYLMTSTDGISFEKVGKAFGVEESVMVPSVLQVNGVWHYYGNQIQGGPIYHGVSSDDGLTFDRVDSIDLSADGIRYFVGNGIAADGGYRLYAYAREPNQNGWVGSFFSEDGYDWEFEGITLEVSIEKFETNFVKDPSVIQLPDGSWLMIYPTDIPK